MLQMSIYWGGIRGQPGGVKGETHQKAYNRAKSTLEPTVVVVDTKVSSMEAGENNDDKIKTKPLSALLKIF